MVRRRRSIRKEMPRDPAGIVRNLRSCRESMLEMQEDVKLFGPTYKLGQGVLVAIDTLADHLAMKPHYFSVGGFGANDAARQETLNWIAREKGDLPWPR